MAKITLNNLASLQNETSAINIINTNNDAIETAMENTLSRNGTAPNQMGAELDMNSNRILNLPEPVTETEPIRRVEFDTLVTNGNASTVTVGTTTTVPQATAAEVTNSGTIYNAVLNFKIPQGIQGDVAHSGSVTDGHLVVWDGNVGNLIKDGGAPTPATSLWNTGEIKIRYGTGAYTGYVRCNGLTIGSASSGATERANADTQNLFTFLWNADPNLVVSGGRGANAAADWTANKNITVPDFRSRTLAGLGDMGNSDNGLFSGATFTTGNSTTLGSTLGTSRRTLVSGNIPSHNHAVFLNDPGHSHSVPYQSNNAAGGSAIAWSAGGNAQSLTAAATTTGITVRDTAGGLGTANQTATTGSGTAFDTVSPYALVTIYIKL